MEGRSDGSSWSRGGVLLGEGRRTGIGEGRGETG